MLLGRAAERQSIDAAIDAARHGRSAALVLVGEAGIGKSRLLEYAAATATGMQLLRASGVESEAQIPFASLFALLRPALARLDRLPQPQATALESALALRPAGADAERFAVGAATLGLLAAHGEAAPLLLLIDDAHWLDRPSAEAVLFALRRMLGDGVAAIVATREEQPAGWEASGLATLELTGLSAQEARTLVPDLSAAAASRLHHLTAGNPLAIQELAGSAEALVLAPADAPAPVPQRVAQAYVGRLQRLDPSTRRVLGLLAADGTDDLATLERAAAELGLDPATALAEAERAGLVRLAPGRVAFRHPLARSAIYAAGDPDERRAAHRTLATILPDRDFDRRAWHLSAAAVGLDERASVALEQAGIHSRDRAAYATASAAFEQAGRLSAEPARTGSLLLDSGEAAWHAGLGDRAVALLADARRLAPERHLRIDELSGHIAIRRGPIMTGYDILVAASARAPAEQAVALLADAAGACLYGASPEAMLKVGRLARATLPENPTPRARFLAAVACGMAEVIGGDARAGMIGIREAVEVAHSSPDLLGDPRLLPWLAAAPLFLRESEAGRALLEPTLAAARSQAALSTLPFVLNLRARDYATTARWDDAEMSYLEAMELAQETEQLTDLTFSLTGLAMLYAQRGRAAACRKLAQQALELSRERIGARLHEIWALAALGEADLALGDARAAVGHFGEQLALLAELGVTDADVSPTPELVDAALRLGRRELAESAAAQFVAAAEAKGQPWSLARARRCSGLLARDADLDDCFAAALSLHAETADVFETARTQLAYGERLRRARRRRDARDQLRPALDTFESLQATPWAERARAELAASGETLRRRDPSSLDELTPQELQIARLLADGKTTREAAASLFVSPKTVEYHLRHVYLKLGVNSRPALTAAVRR